MRASHLPEHLRPTSYPLPSAPIVSPQAQDARIDIERIVKGQRAAFAFAEKHHLSVLNCGTDRSGTWMIVAPGKHLRDVFGDECAWIHRHVAAGMITTRWLGTHEAANQTIRFFWREIEKCVH